VTSNVRFAYSSTGTICDNAHRVTDSAESGSKVFV